MTTVKCYVVCDQTHGAVESHTSNVCCGYKSWIVGNIGLIERANKSTIIECDLFSIFNQKDINLFVGLKSHVVDFNVLWSCRAVVANVHTCLL